jgi:DNA-binding XRE family transcriptional regulator
MPSLTVQQIARRRELGAALRRERDKAGVSRFKLALIAGTTPTTVQACELGRLPEQTTLRVASALALVARERQEAEAS